MRVRACLCVCEQSQWKDRYAFVKQGVLTLHTESFDKASSAAASVPRLVLDLAGTPCHVYSAKRGDREATTVRWDKSMSSWGCFVIKVPNQRTVFLYFAEREQAESWGRVMGACAKVRLPSRKATADAPPETPVGFAASVASARDIGSEVLFKTYVSHWQPSTGYERITNILTYDALRDMQTELALMFPTLSFPQVPTSRVRVHVSCVCVCVCT